MATHRRLLVLGFIVLSALVLVACSGGATGTVLDGKGQLRIVVSTASGTAAASSTGGGSLAKSADGHLFSDVPSPNHEHPDLSLQAANVTFSSILARTLDGQLINVTIALPVTVDLLSLGTGKDATLPIGFLPPGTYDQLVVVMTEVELVLQDGTKVAITPPGGGWTAIVGVAAPFTVVEGETTSVTIKFRRDLSFGLGGGGWEFHPRFDCGDQDHDD